MTNETEDWEKEFIDKHPMIANDSEFSITVYNFAIPKNLIDYINHQIQKAREEERERITNIVEKWLKTSNPAYAEDLFNALTLQMETREPTRGRVPKR